MVGNVQLVSPGANGLLRGGGRRGVGRERGRRKTLQRLVWLLDGRETRDTHHSEEEPAAVLMTRLIQLDSERGSRSAVGRMSVKVAFPRGQLQLQRIPSYVSRLTILPVAGEAGPRPPVFQAPWDQLAGPEPAMDGTEAGPRQPPSLSTPSAADAEALSSPAVPPVSPSPATHHIRNPPPPPEHVTTQVAS